MKVGILGLGSIGARHFENLMVLGHGVRGWDPKNKGTELEREELIAWADAVVIASPTVEHLKDAEDCYKAAKPIFIEKPVWNSRHAHLAQWTRGASDTPAMVGYNLRFNQAVMQARRILKSGLLGKPQWASVTVAQLSNKPVYLRDGVILNWSHEIDLAMYLLGHAKVLAASAETQDGHDYLADIILRHDTGCRSTVHLDYLGNPEIRATTIMCEKATITIDLKNRWGCIMWADGRPREEHTFSDSWDDNYREEMRAFIALAEGKPLIEYEHCTAEQGLSVLDICLQARKKAGLK